MRNCLSQIWRELGRSLFEGERYERSMRGITLFAALIVVVNVITGYLNFSNGYYSAAFTAPLFIVAGLIIIYFTQVRRDRTGAVAVALIAVVVVFTYEVFSVTHGFPIFWTMILPLAFCYLGSVRAGVGLSLYFLVLYWVLFYTPLRFTAAAHYSDVIVQRFPILYLADVLLTTYIMVQYHRNTLHLMDNARQLLEAKRAADEANASKSAFLANMSHEIRTPINAVLGMNEMILRESRHAAELSPPDLSAMKRSLGDIGLYASDVESAGTSLLSIINDILDFSKIEAGKMELAEGDYQLSSVLNDVSNMTLFRARDKGLDFVVDVDETLPNTLHGDEVRVRQVITNLLSNAVKYTQRGSVRLVMRGTVQGTPEPGAELLLRVSVADTGIGIRQEDQEKLFSKFQRLDLKQNSTVEGTGLGLAITRSLLDMMGGSIAVESQYQAGTVFTVTLPQRVVSVQPVGNFQCRFQQSVLEAGAYRESFRAPDARILIVDDTKMNLTVAAGLLKDTRVRIDTAMSGQESIDLARDRDYDLILMDQRMPGMDGTQALRRIRALENARNRNTPVICLTADAVVGARERYLSKGFSDYLTKPIDSRALERMLVRTLPREKVHIVSREDPEQSPLSVPEQGLYDPLRRSGIDPAVGLEYAQNEEAFYQTLLREFVRSGRERDMELERMVQAGDWPGYSVQIHALKSTSRMIGAGALSRCAAGLEAAADEGKADAIAQGHPGLMEQYRSVLQAIDRVLPQVQQPEADEEDVLEFLPEET